MNKYLRNTLAVIPESRYGRPLSSVSLPPSAT